MATEEIWRLLSPDLIELQIGQIDLLLAMYPDDIVQEETSRTLIECLRDGTYSKALRFDAPQASFGLCLSIQPPGSDAGTPRRLRLDLTVPFAYQGETAPEEPPRIKVRIQQSIWMNKASTSDIMKNISDMDDVLETIEYIQEAGMQQLAQSAAQTSHDASIAKTTGPLVRVWFYFPSISTRSKRDDFIVHAPSYALTGFLYAGKPGLLCVEGTSKDIDDYMKFIKTESWGDIPAHHKKVSERYRENLGEGESNRAFADMQEITDSVGERRGTRANRGDMKAVEEWLVEKGVGDAFAKVLM